MLRVLMGDAQPGMRLALPVYHPRTSKRLLAQGFALDEPTIERLHALKVHEAWIEYPNTEDITNLISPKLQRKESELLSKVADLFDESVRDTWADLDFTAYRDLIKEFFEAMLLDRDSAAYIAQMAGDPDCVFRHAGSVCVLSLLMGLTLQDYLISQRSRMSARHARNIVGLGLGAMMHDIGLLAFDADRREELLCLADESDPDWLGHSEAGYRQVTGVVDPVAAAVVLHHHQHYDGSGFPVIKLFDGTEQPQSGEDIHVFARIVCVADHFDRLCNPAEDAVAIPRVIALKRMLSEPMHARFDPFVIDALLNIAPAYVPGSQVTLSSGEEAIVTEWHRETPCRPTVQTIATNTDGRPWPPPDDADAPRGRRYDLREQPELSVIRQDGYDVERANFTRPRRPLDGHGP